MRKQNEYTRNHRLSYQIAGVLIIIATLGFTFMYFYQKNTQKQQEIAKQEEQQESENVSKTIEPESKEVDMAALQRERMNAGKTADAEKENSEAESTVNQVAETSNLNLHFPEQLAWPMEGKVILNFSMDQTVYFQTLKQYQYNPALIISGKVNDKVCSACEGKVVSVLNDAKTGTTLTLDIGDGYQAVYGQLKEIPVATGEYVAKGQCIGYLAEPTKYYLSEGPNLYFQVLQEGNPVNPQDYLEQ